MDAAAVAELQEQPVAAGRRLVGAKASSSAFERVDMLVGEIAGAQHDEVAARAEVGLQVVDAARRRGRR